MKDESANLGGPAAGATSAPGLPAAVDRASFQAELDRLRVREKAHSREGDTPGVLPARRRPRLRDLLDDPPRPEAMDYSYALMDLTVYGRQEPWEDSPPAGHNSAPTRGLTVGRPPGHRSSVAGRTPHRPVAAPGRRAL